jgi:hypothetical protein
MESKLFADLTRLLKSAPVGSSLPKVVLKHANKAQTKQLADKFEELYSTSSKGNVSARRAPKKTEEIEEEDMSTAKRIAITLGGYGHEAGAKEAAQQFLHPNVFQYQSAIFPDPRTHSVDAKVTRARPVALKDPNPLYPWGVRLELAVRGAGTAVSSWITQFKNQIRVNSVS